MNESRYVFLRTRKVLYKSCRENQNTHFVFSKAFLRKSCLLWDNVEKHSRPGRPKDENIGNAHYIQCELVEITNKMQPCNRIYHSNAYWRLNMFREAYRSSSGVLNCICSLWFIYTHVVIGRCPGWVGEAANTVWSSWWWAVYRLKHVEPSINLGIINSVTRLHFFGYFYWFILRCTDPWIVNLRFQCL